MCIWEGLYILKICNEYELPYHTFKKLYKVQNTPVSCKTIDTYVGFNLVYNKDGILNL